ncbi:T9SS type A sorting domain-containing protein [Seonamhaeicola sp. MEBiC1930]|uniref:T9SS type A sorting domain-containing protein n=1 Tax=Seonamhaeicola sp. MEBiC01930 TaxID=2976768 RepID=UPI00324A5622
MKTKLLFTKKQSLTLFALLAFCLCINYGWSQTNLTLNSTCGGHTFDVNDNADSFDCTPNSTLDDSAASPYRAIWYNSDLDAWLDTFYSDNSEQPSATSDGNKFGPKAEAGRGLKLNEASRRIYQKVEGLTPGTSYTFFVDSRSEQDGVDTFSDVFMLNTEIVDETGLNANGAGDSSVDGYMQITNDYNGTKSSDTEDTFTTSSLEFTATSNFVVILIRSTSSTSSSLEVFYDNIELYETSSLSTSDVLASKFKVFPNPVQDVITIQSNNINVSAVSIYNVLGKEVLSQKGLSNSDINVSNLNSGMYLLKISTDEGVLNKKILVE